MARANLFADTSGWASLADPTQPYHHLAAENYRNARQQRRKVITTNYVIGELVALLTSPLRLPRQALIKFVDSIKTSPYVQVIHIDADLDLEAWQLLKQRVDKQWSLVDASSFVVMQRLGIYEALTSDHHFEQSGFVRLLK